MKAAWPTVAGGEEAESVMTLASGDEVSSFMLDVSSIAKSSSLSPEDSGVSVAANSFEEVSALATAIAAVNWG